MKKIVIGCVLFGVAVVLSGCIVSSIYPFFFPKDVIEDSSLVGRWKDVDKNGSGDADEYMEIQPFKKSSYLMGTFSSNETNWMETQLFEIKKRRFFDQRVYSTNGAYEFGFTREHFICSVITGTNSLRLAWMSQDWLEQLLKKNARAIRHTTVYDDPGSTNGRAVLTADTKELQKFILKYVSDTNAFYEVSYRKIKDL